MNNVGVFDLTQGTVIRVFNIPQGEKLFEFRRGIKRWEFGAVVRYVLKLMCTFKEPSKNFVSLYNALFAHTGSFTSTAWHSVRTISTSPPPVVLKLSTSSDWLTHQRRSESLIVCTTCAAKVFGTAPGNVVCLHKFQNNYLASIGMWVYIVSPC